MEKPFWMKLLVSIVIFMTLVFGILPTGNTLAGESGQIHHVVLTDEEGWFFFTAINETIQLILTDFGSAGIEDIYYEDESGNRIAPKIEVRDGISGVILEKDKKYTATLKEYALVEHSENDPDYDWVMKNMPRTTKDGNKEIDGSTYNYIKTEDDASFFEGVICRILLLIGTGAYVIVCLVVGDAFTVEKIIFDEYTNIKLSFFESDISLIGENKFLTSANIGETLNDLFGFFTSIAIIAYMVILVYMAIRILLGVGAEKGSRYKELIVYWLQGILILFLFPYIMRYTIKMNHAFVKFIYENKNNFMDADSGSLPEAEPVDGDLGGLIKLINDMKESLLSKGDYMALMYQNGMETGFLVYAICWYVMFFQMIGFLIVYFKRVLITMFLITIFPLVTISYAIDKVGDGKSQAFENWMKEFMLNVFVQSFHAITYVLIMAIVFKLSTDPRENWLLMIIALSFISKGDNILRAIFSLKGSADTVKGVGATILQTAAISKVAGSISGLGSRLMGEGSLNRQVFNKIGNVSQKGWDKAANRVESEALRLDTENDHSSILSQDDINNMTDEQLKNDIQGSINTVLGNSPTASDDEIRRATDKLTGYLNNEDERVQGILNDASKGLSEEQQKKLDNMLKQNTAINALVVGGKEVNVRQNIDIVLSSLTRGKNGKLTKESLALLQKIGKSESDLQVMKLFGKVKFSKSDRGDKYRTSNNPEFARRDARLMARRYRGRRAAGQRNSVIEENGSKTEIGYLMRGGTLEDGNKSTGRQNGKSKRTNTNRTLSRRGRKSSAKRARLNAVRSPQMGRKNSRISGIKKPNKPWQNITSVAGSQGLLIAQQGAKARYKISSRTRKNGTVPNPAIQTSRAEKNVDPIMRVMRYVPTSSGSADKKSVPSGTDYGDKVPTRDAISTSADKTPPTVREMKQKKENAREYIQQRRDEAKNRSNSARQKGGAYYTIKRGRSTEGKKNREQKIKKAREEAINIPNSNQTSSRSSGGGSTYNVGAPIASVAGSSEGLRDAVGDTRNFAPKFSRAEKKRGEQVLKDALDAGNMDSYEDEVKQDLLSAASSVAVLADNMDGKECSALQLLDNIKNLIGIINKYGEDTEKANVLGKFVDLLGGCKPEDYESFLRIKILNDPGSVENDRQIIDECKEYVKNTDMPGAIRSRLAYSERELEAGRNLKYAQKIIDPQTAGYASEEEKSHLQSEYDRMLKIRKMKQLDEENKTKYGAGSFAKDVAGIAITGAGAAVSNLATIGSAAAGLVSAGMTTDGKNETITTATTGFFAGRAAANDVYDNTLGRLVNSGVKKYDEHKWKAKDANQTKAKNIDPIEDLRDKTKINTASFEERAKKNK